MNQVRKEVPNMLVIRAHMRFENKYKYSLKLRQRDHWSHKSCVNILCFWTTYINLIKFTPNMQS